ncbi:excitatory amino acid transporter 1-like isoform X2 [Ornithorhynchus anatinus]|uniref:Amino acid transporter n=1 Tax=Ornithorhynchus anatinus TaxID=9258 RepID=A0A6I8NPU5_ORNAN|nr:excitatory amino acid transporter 1-like isoform X2 [Ornithorhynchus anatinus]
MGESRAHANSLFLNEAAAKRLSGETRLQQLHLAMQHRAARARLQVQTLTRERVLSFLRRNAFLLLTISSVIIGISLAFALRPYKMSYRQIKYFSFPGELLMRMLQMLVLPLIVSSLVTGMASLDSASSGRMGVRAVVYYMVTTVLAVFTGILMVTIIHPGKGSKTTLHREGQVEQVSAADAFMDLIRNMFPPNLVEACFKQFKTHYSTRVVTRVAPRSGNMTESGPSLSPPPENVTGILYNVSQALGSLQKVLKYEEVVPVPGSVSGVNALGLVVFSVCFGLVVGRMKQKGRILQEFFDSLNEAIMHLVGIIICSATLPITFRCLEENIGVDRRITRFVLPVGATINMDGTALYEALAAIFIAQVNNYELNLGQIITISITATAASIGAAGIPQAGLVTMVIVLTSVGLPSEDITLIIAVDWFLDRLRTMTNVLGDALGAGIVEHLSRHELDTEQDVEPGRSGLRESAKPYHLIAQENPSHKHRGGETKM